ncbi:MAG: hypothetical protein ACOYJD_08050 [Christensenellales bacterium]|jgi:hypothetical protein
MWWIYQKIYEDERIIRYSYSCESNDADGIIRFDKETKEWHMEKASAKDEHSEWSIGQSLEHFYRVVQDGFPSKRTVATG